MKQKIYDIPVWDAYGIENLECPLCKIEQKMERDLMDILFDDMLMTPYFAVKLQQYCFCSEHYRRLYVYKDKLGLALIVNNFLQCEKENLEKQLKTKFAGKKISLINKIRTVLKPEKKQVEMKKKCYLCEKIEENMPDYAEVLIKLWSKNDDFKKLYSNAKGHCQKHYDMLMQMSLQLLSQTKVHEFSGITAEMQLENTKRLIEELDWFVQKFDYRFQDEPWKNSKDALPRCINKLTGNFNE